MLDSLLDLLGYAALFVLALPLYFVEQRRAARATRRSIAP